MRCTARVGRAGDNEFAIVNEVRIDLRFCDLREARESVYVTALAHAQKHVLNKFRPANADHANVCAFSVGQVFTELSEVRLRGVHSVCGTHLLGELAPRL